MPDSYSSQCRETVLAQVRVSRSIFVPAEGWGVSTTTIFRRKKQDQIDAGDAVVFRPKTGPELRAARARIAELEAELATVKRASELFGQGRVVGPKEPFPIVEQLDVEGYGLKSACRVLQIPSSSFFVWRHPSSTIGP